MLRSRTYIKYVEVLLALAADVINEKLGHPEMPVDYAENAVASALDKLDAMSPQKRFHDFLEYVGVNGTEQTKIMGSAP